MADTPENLLCVLENTASVLRKAQSNLKKCPKQRLTRGYIETKLQSIQEDWNIFKQTHLELVKCVPKEQQADIPYLAKEEFFVYEDLYTCIQADLRDLLACSGAPTQPKSGAEHNNSYSVVKLPRINLPVFSGIYEEWPAYQDLFISLVHNNSALSKVQKLHYLKSTLNGEAESLLRHVQVTDDSYEQAWATLKSRYGNKRIIVNSVLKRLFMQRKITTQTASCIKSLFDTTTECINSLKNQGISTSSWDPLIIFIVVQKLDPETHREWEQYAYKDNSDELSTYSDLNKFLQSKFRTLELIAPPSRERSFKPREHAVHVATTVKARNCSMCNEEHTLCHCKEFTKMQTTERCDYAKTNNLCFNCLAPGHSARRCHLNMSCRVCHKRHHTLLHQSTSVTSPNRADNIQANHSKIEEQEKDQTMEPNLELSSHLATGTSTALLATALVPVQDDAGRITVLRALVDHGSQATFISERAAQMLQVKRTPVKGTITGVGSTTTTVKHAARIELRSRHDPSFKMKVKVYVMSTRLTTQLPSQTISRSSWPHLQGLELADPSFNQPGRVDMLLGVDVCAQIMKSELIKGPPGTPCAQNTSLGWILFGNIHHDEPREEVLVMHLNLDLDDMLKRMWEHDDEEKRKPTAEETKCEEIYLATTTRTEDGRYMVKLPMKTETILSTHGGTRDIALRRLYQLERKFKQDPNLQSEYIKVMEEYKEMNHMQEVPKIELIKPAVYLPHHAVVKEEKETSKFRTVFNASQKGNNNISLNDELLVGPQLQDDMRSLIMRWRMKRVCFVADIQKMYRQILVTKEDRDLQRVLWRKNSNEPVKDYQLLRVTFGTASAPFLAVRTLHQVADDEGLFNPDAVQTIKGDFYMDDLMSGKDTLEEAITLAKDIDTILQKGGFVLQKWCSNNADFLLQFEPSQRSSHVKLDISIDGTIRALGLHWNMGRDVFQYSLSLPDVPNKITKRTILADIQRLFDPLGWLAPAILPTKLLIQRLWLQGTTWDEQVDPTIAHEWTGLRESFQHLSDVEIDRWLNTTDNVMEDCSVHGFCDASNRAYAAVAYLRVRTTNGDIKTSIIAAKTRVASTKAKSLPRLELCGAALLAGLLKQIKEAMRIPVQKVFAWTDSTIVLSWLQGDPNRWQTYVRNRVVNILDDIGDKWYHVKSQFNPADVASRGALLSDLLRHELWWNGPDWLKTEDIPFDRPNSTTDLEIKKNINVNFTITKNEDITRAFEDFENLSQLLKAITYSKRFLNSKKFTVPIALTTEELESSLKICIKLVQKQVFYEDMDRLAQNKQVKSDSPLRSLNPYLDEERILRVGGRLRHSDLSEESKHPIILDSKNHLTSLLVAEAHQKTLHGGLQLMLCYLRTKYWILRPKSIVKTYIRKCLICARQSATAKKQLMGDLPKERITPARAFLNSGVDFAGPYQTLMSRGRGQKSYKSYIAIFVCMATKAVHLELVGDMTSDAFIGAFRRFVSRRGKCAHLWSDQGRNFVGANKALNDAFREAKFDFDVDIAKKLTEDGTQWHFIPAYSPNFGGLWEAGVRSIKFHLKRILDTNLTFEELTTLLCQIEACLNSRPYTNIEGDNSTDPLTPGHFLIGEAPITVPSPTFSDAQVSHLSRWQHMQKLLNDFWHKWQQEYLTRLQQRTRWTKKEAEFEIGQIVLIKNENLPPGKWLMGRIVDKHAGADGLTRVYSVKTGDNIVRRSVSKLCYYPVDINLD